MSELVKDYISGEHLGSKYETVLDQRIPIGSYPVELSVYHSKIAGLRIVAAKLRISGDRLRAMRLPCRKGVK